MQGILLMSTTLVTVVFRMSNFIESPFVSHSKLSIKNDSADAAISSFRSSKPNEKDRDG